MSKIFENHRIWFSLTFYTIFQLLLELAELMLHSCDVRKSGGGFIENMVKFTVFKEELIQHSLLPTVFMHFWSQVYNLCGKII